MSNSYMGPRDPFLNDMLKRGPIKEPFEMWESIQKERQKELDNAKLEHIQRLEDAIRKAEEKDRKDNDNSFDLGGAL